MIATSTFTPHPYQQTISKFIVNNDKSLIIVDMGLGKTAATLQALESLFYQYMIKKCLVIAPLRVAKQRVAGFMSDAQINIINRENVPWMVRSGPWLWDCLVIDESSSFKNQSSQRFRALKAVIKKVRRVILLTGTPAPNSLLELWPQVYLLDMGRRFGGYTRFRDQHFQQNYDGSKYVIRPGGKENIYKKIEDISISMKGESFLKLPDRTDINVEIDLPGDAMETIKRLEELMTVEIEEKDITAVNSAVLAGKLLQAASGSIYDDEGEPQTIHRGKLWALEDLIESANGQSVLVAYNYKHEMRRIMESFPDAIDIKNKGAIERWNKGEIELMLAHPASAGHGLNLQNGGSIIVWFSLTWSLELWQQFNARLHRQGQKNPVRIYRIMAKDTIDYCVMDRLDQKMAGQDALINYLSNK